MIGLVVAFAVALIATPVAARVATRAGFVDRPGPLKVQRQPVPYLGGLAVFVAFAIPVAFLHASLLLPLAMALVLGLVDDLRTLPAPLRLGAEVVIGLVAGLVATAPGPFGILVTALFVVGLVNAINLLDGLDGLAGGVALVSAIGFAIVGGAARGPSLALAGALAGFLVFNRPPARIYLGDAGAYFVGAAHAMLAVLALGAADGPAGWAAVPLLVALPIVDTTIAIVRRARARRPVFGGDRGHVYDQLVDRGITTGWVTAAFAAVQAVLTMIGVVTIHLGAAWAFASAGLVVVGLGFGAAVGGFVSATEGSTT
ncbi:MAG: UDP-GlcNAc:undecaprenyl-phosphate/decaprenyl-phosphate GlcNAc-phosphate transferase [Actinomycetota bacterium]|nr:UDP-GlcNAc:undecaprenyl-phosphate/decaprenyl-phosphate GlcNAc-phosphate transferase [Actinomycetota bacterium]